MLRADLEDDAKKRLGLEERGRAKVVGDDVLMC
jgi:hypothetical protein